MKEKIIDQVYRNLPYSQRPKVECVALGKKPLKENMIIIHIFLLCWYLLKATISKVTKQEFVASCRPEKELQEAKKNVKMIINNLNQTWLILMAD